MTLTVASVDGAPPPATEYPSFPPVLQPMVITHGESGRKSLLLSPLGYPLTVRRLVDRATLAEVQPTGRLYENPAA